MRRGRWEQASTRQRKLLRSWEEASRWDVVASTQLPKGHHTVSYVEKVLDTYSYYYSKY